MKELSIAFGDYKLNDLARINVIIGRNGSGKSTVLRQLDSSELPDLRPVRYISPERAGTLHYDAGIDSAIQGDSRWMSGHRRRNQVNNFKQQSFIQLSRLERRILRAFHDTDGKASRFDPYLAHMNALLDNVKVTSPAGDKDKFIIQSKDATPTDREPTTLSSGEAELIVLATEILFFGTEVESGKEGMLLLDEPDVHLHPDLQVRLMKLLIEQSEKLGYRVLIATHSTTVLSCLSGVEDSRVCFMKNKRKDLNFIKAEEAHKAVLPVFGAHPLTRVFNEAPPLLLEGDDDVRIWQQAIRSSVGTIRLYPCGCGGKDSQPSYEAAAIQIIESIYEAGKCYSLYDSDGNDQQLHDNHPVVRIRLSCRASENLMLCDEVLASQSTDWSTLQGLIRDWLLQTPPSHRAHPHMKRFLDGGFDRLNFDLKEIRNILIGLITSKPWEVIVGQSIAQLHKTGVAEFEKEGSLAAALGQKACEQLLGVKQKQST